MNYNLQVNVMEENLIIPPFFNNYEDSILSPPEIGGKCSQSFAGRKYETIAIFRALDVCGQRRKWLFGSKA